MRSCRTSFPSTSLQPCKRASLVHTFTKRDSPHGDTLIKHSLPTEWNSQTDRRKGSHTHTSTGWLVWLPSFLPSSGNVYLFFDGDNVLRKFRPPNWLLPLLLLLKMATFSGKCWAFCYCHCSRVLVSSGSFASYCQGVMVNLQLNVVLLLPTQWMNL